MSKVSIGKPAPAFTGEAVVDSDFTTISLSDYNKRYVVLFFYPADFTFVCPTEIIAFSDRAKEFEALNCVVIAASTDTKFSHFAWTSVSRKQGGLGDMKIPVLADPTHRIAKDYGVLKETEGTCFRGLFIIDCEGIVRQITINDVQVGRSVDETLRLVRALRDADKQQELQPSLHVLQWKKLF